MPLFKSDFISLCYSNIAAGKKWWIDSFDCKEAKAIGQDHPLPSDVALQLPGHDQPTIWLRHASEVQNAGYQPSNEHPILFCSNLKKAFQHLTQRGVATGPTQHSGGTEFFEVRDPESNIIEICKEP